MCLAVEGKILTIKDGSAKVDFGGILREIRLDLAPESKIGDIILAHAGYAIENLSHGH